MTIRLRLTFYYSVLALIGLAIFSLLIIFLIQNSLNTDLDTDLRLRAEQILNRNLISGDPQAFTNLGKFLGTQGSPVGPNTPNINMPPEAQVDLQRELAYVEVVALDPTHTIKGQESLPKNIEFMNRPDVQARLHQLADSYLNTTDVITRNAEGRYSTFTIADQTIRLYTLPVTDQNGLLGYIQVARSPIVIEGVKSRAVAALGIGFGVTIILFVTFGWMLNRREFASLDAITRAAVRISRNPDLDLTERINVVDRPSPVTRLLRFVLGRSRLRLDTSSEVSRLTDAFNAMLERIETSFRNQRQFIADSSHELRTPLTVIMGNLDLLRRNPDPRNQAESVQAIEKEARRMQKLVNDLLLLAQADARVQAAPQNLGPIEMDSIVFDVFKQGRVLAADKGQKLTLEHTDVVRAIGDADQIKRAVLNLVENAVKYTPEGGAVSLGLYREGAEVKVVVRDNGIGIAKEDQGRIFDRFYRVDKARTRSSGGTGLGLAIVKHIAESNGGRISVESEPAIGSTFTLWLRCPDPAAPPDDNPQDAANTPVPAQVA